MTSSVGDDIEKREERADREREQRREKGEREKRRREREEKWWFLYEGFLVISQKHGY